MLVPVEVLHTNHSVEKSPFHSLSGGQVSGLYGMALFRHVLQHPIVLVVAALPTLLALIGALILVREIQLFRAR